MLLTVSLCDAPHKRVSCTRPSLLDISAYRANSDTIDGVLLIEQSHIVRKHVRDGVKYPHAILGVWVAHCSRPVVNSWVKTSSTITIVSSRKPPCAFLHACEVSCPSLLQSVKVQFGGDGNFSSTGPTYHRLFSSTRTTHPRCYHHVHNSNTWHTYTFMRMKLR
jgi:hypothetical protein